MFNPKDLYYAAPYPLKAIAASARGSILNRWRYGTETEELVARAHDLERQPRDQLLARQQACLSQLLERAASSVPHYRDLRPTPDSFETWPILRKEELRQNAQGFLSKDTQQSELFSLHTSGSTGTPVQLWIARHDLQQWYALFEARCRQWYGVDRTDRWAILGGQLVAHPKRRRPPYWVWNRAMRQLYLSSYHVSNDTVGDYLEAMKQHRVRYLVGYPSAMYDVARRAIDLDLDGPELEVVLSNAEPLHAHQRDAIGRVFGCQVRDSYGTTEMACGASECEHGSLHLWPEAGILEVVDDDGVPVQDGEVGRLICTGLINSDMPLIRYEIGDRGALARPNDTCACGRTLPILRSLEGRLDDLILTRDGRTIGRLDTIFKDDLPIQKAQIIQESMELIRVLVVVDEGASEAEFTATADVIEQRLLERVGETTIRIDSVDEIPLSSNGKFRAVKSLVSAPVKA